jgi:uncharacterized protein YbaA (DUF1428 family)
VIPVPEEKMDAYRKWAENGAALFKLVHTMGRE